MDPQEREELIQKLQKENDDFIANLKTSEYKDGWKEETWEKEMQEHPLFTTDLPEGAELPPLVEALQQLKYDSEVNGPEELAENYKDDGNNNFKLKKYRWAVASYSEGLKQKCSNPQLNAQLYCNRAAAHFHLGNHGSALSDATSALKLKPDYVKAATRAALCCWELKRPQECVTWCKKALELDPRNGAMQDLMDKAENLAKQFERDRRKEQQRAKREAEKAAALRDALARRGITTLEPDDVMETSEDGLTPIHPALQSHKVHLSEDGAATDSLVWPAIFLYPEVMESDFVQQFDERATFSDQLFLLFGDQENQPGWNADRRYAPGSVTVWFKDRVTGAPVPILPTRTLKEVVCDKRFEIENGTASFWVTPKGTDYEKKFAAGTGKC